MVINFLRQDHPRGGACPTRFATFHPVVEVPSVTPEIPEPRRRKLGVTHRVLNVLVSEVGLKRPRIVAL